MCQDAQVEEAYNVPGRKFCIRIHLPQTGRDYYFQADSAFTCNDWMNIIIAAGAQNKIGRIVKRDARTPSDKKQEEEYLRNEKWQQKEQREQIKETKEM